MLTLILILAIFSLFAFKTPCQGNLDSSMLCLERWAVWDPGRSAVADSVGGTLICVCSAGSCRRRSRGNGGCRLWRSRYGRRRSGGARSCSSSSCECSPALQVLARPPSGVESRLTEDCACRSFPQLWPFLAAYWIWMYIDKSPEKGGRLSPWFRSTAFWRYFAEYYPAS